MRGRRHGPAGPVPAGIGNPPGAQEPGSFDRVDALEAAAARLPGPPARQLTRAVICAHVSGRSDPEIGKNSNRVGLIRGRSRPMMARWGSLAANLSRLAWSSQTENVQNVFRARPAFSV